MSVTRRYGVYLGDLDRGRTSSHGIINFALSATVGVTKLAMPDEQIVIFASSSMADELPDDLSAVRSNESSTISDTNRAV